MVHSSDVNKNEPLILAIESATPVSSVALFRGEQEIALMEFSGQMLHAKLITRMIEQLLENLDHGPEDLDAIIIAKGPGSYTGLRVGVSAAKGLCMALDIPLLAIDSLEILAWQAKELAEQLDAMIIPMIDARRMEVYTAQYDPALTRVEEISAKIIEGSTFSGLLAQRKGIFVGSGAEKCREILGEYSNAIVLGNTVSSARAMGKIAHAKYVQKEFEDLITFEPFYLKDFVATQSKKKLL